ncbi:MAG TPA: hypothetical protein VK034_10055 [Enhygromyxa sp.]|nr:hypothetical protein [Enhygromyxa sp.]
MSLFSTLSGLADDDVKGVERTLASASEGAGHIVTIAMSLVSSRPILAYRIQAALARQPEPARPIDREHWLRAHNNACYLAVFHGNPAEKRDVVDRALRVAPRNVAIYHNAACLLCQLGEAERALRAIRDGIDRGYDDATIKAIAEDPDLDLIRHTEAFQQIIRGRVDFEPPAWASGWTAWELIQFREDLRTTLSDPDLTRFDEGRIACSHGHDLDIVALAQQCKRHAPSEWGRIVRDHFLALLSN